MPSEVMRSSVVLPPPGIQQDYVGAREKMVREQVIARGVDDPGVIEAMLKIPRHLFVDSGLAERAYEEGSLPIGNKQTLSQPYIAGCMTAALKLSGHEKVLEIGTGSGYQTALLAELCVNVFSVEKIRALAAKARTLLDRLGYYNVAIHVGDGTLGWSEHAPFDAILVTAGAPVAPRPLIEQLSVGGVLVIPLGDEESQVLKCIRRTPSGLSEEPLGDCRFVKLRGKYGWQD